MNNRTEAGLGQEGHDAATPTNEYRLGAIIVARLDSQRFPGKVLHPLLGRPLLAHVAQRCRQARSIQNRIVVATTSRPIDNPIARFAAAQDLGVFRGDTSDVARRLLECARSLDWDGFFRVNADSPCLDPFLFDCAAEVFSRREFDLVTNLHPRSFPYGISVELVRTKSFARAYANFEKAEHREHATLYCYEHAKDFRIFNLTNPNPNPNTAAPQPRLTVDTPEDLAVVEEYLTNQAASATPSPRSDDAMLSRPNTPSPSPLSAVPSRPATMTTPLRPGYVAAHKPVAAFA